MSKGVSRPKSDGRKGLFYCLLESTVWPPRTAKNEAVDRSVERFDLRSIRGTAVLFAHKLVAASRQHGCRERSAAKYARSTCASRPEPKRKENRATNLL